MAAPAWPRGRPREFGAAVRDRWSAASRAGWQAHAAEDRFGGVFKAQQVSMVNGVEGDHECVRAAVDLERAEVEAYLPIAADAVGVGPLAVGEQVGTSGVRRA